MTTSRLSTAARKLEMDEKWHPFIATPHAWYRVWKKKLVQRVNFGSPEEEERFLPYFEALEPLPELATVSGFREELALEERGTALVVELPLGYEPEQPKEVYRTFRDHGMQHRLDGNLLYVQIPVARLDRETLIDVQQRLVAGRLYFQAAAASTDAVSRAAAREGFERMLMA